MSLSSAAEIAVRDWPTGTDLGYSRELLLCQEGMIPRSVAHRQLQSFCSRVHSKHSAHIIQTVSYHTLFNDSLHNC